MCLAEMSGLDNPAWLALADNIPETIVLTEEYYNHDFLQKLKKATNSRIDKRDIADAKALLKGVKAVKRREVVYERKKYSVLIKGPLGENFSGCAASIQGAT